MRLGNIAPAIAVGLIGLLLMAALLPESVLAQSGTDAVQPELIRSLGHSGFVKTVEYSPDGKFVLTGSSAGTALLWDLDTGLELRRFEIPGLYLHAAAFSPDGRTALTATDNTVALWDVVTGAELRRFAGDLYMGQVMSVAFSPDGNTVLAGAWGPAARLWDVATGTELQRFGRKNWSGSSSLVNSVAFSADGRTVLTGSGNDNVARLWDVASGAESQTFVGHSNHVTSAAFSPDGKNVLTGSDDQTARLWDLATGAELRQFVGHTDGVREAVFSPDGQAVLTASYDGTARIWNVTTGAEQYRTRRMGRLESAAFSPDGQSFLTGSWDNSARLLDSTTGTELRQFVGHTSQVRAAKFSPDGQLIVTAGMGMGRVWSTATGSQLRGFSGYRGLVAEVAASPDGRTMLTGGHSGPAMLWDATTGTVLQQLSGHTESVTSVAFSPDGLTALTGSADHTVRLWDVATGAEIRQFLGHNHQVRSVAFSPDGRTVLSGALDEKSRLWDVETGAELRWFGEQISEEARLERRRSSSSARGVTDVAFSPDGRTVIMANFNKPAELWDVATGSLIQQFTGHTYGISVLAFSPDGRLLVTGSSGDGTTLLYDVATGAELHEFVGHGMEVFSVAFSPDGQFVLTTSHDKTARLWDVATGSELAQLISFEDGDWAVIDPAGRFDASNGGDVQGLHWVSGLEVIKLSQLKDRYYEPGLLSKILGIQKESVRDVQAFSEVALYPELSLQAPTADRTTLDIKLRNRGGGLGRVWVAINGKEIATDARGTGFDSTADEASIAVDVVDHPYIIAGADNSIEVKVYNSEGYLVSRGQRVTWRAPGAVTSEVPELWAVIAGVSDYSGDALDLNFAAKDAAAFGSALVNGAERLFGTERVHLVQLGGTDESANLSPTRDNLVRALQGLANAKPTDVVLVYLAGHGVTHGGQDGDYYFLTQQATSFELNDPAVREAVAISSDELTELIKLTPANKQVLILDTCGAGRVVELSETRGVPSSQTRALDRMKDRTGFYILAGSAADAVSYEASAYGQGLLTYSLLEGMRGAALRESEFLDVSRWFGYAADRVPVIARHIGGVQRPQIATPRGTGSFDVARLTEIERGQINLQQPLPFVIQAVFQLDGPPIDPLDLTPRVNAALRDVSARGTLVPWVFVDTSEYADAYQLSGRYAVNKSTDSVVVNVYLLQENEVISTKVVTGTVASIDSLIDGIVAVARDMRSQKVN